MSLDILLPILLGYTALSGPRRTIVRYRNCEANSQKHEFASQFILFFCRDHRGIERNEQPHRSADRAEDEFQLSASQNKPSFACDLLTKMTHRSRKSFVE